MAVTNQLHKNYSAEVTSYMHSRRRSMKKSSTNDENICLDCNCYTEITCRRPTMPVLVTTPNRMATTDTEPFMASPTTNTSTSSAQSKPPQTTTTKPTTSVRNKSTIITKASSRNRAIVPAKRRTPTLPAFRRPAKKEHSQPIFRPREVCRPMDVYYAGSGHRSMAGRAGIDLFAQSSLVAEIVRKMRADMEQKRLQHRMFQK